MEEIKKLDAQTLPDDLRQKVLDACKRKAVPNPVYIVICITLFLGLIRSMVSLIRFAASSPVRPINVIETMLPYVILFGFTYIVLIKPIRLFKLAKDNKYTYYIGTLTDKRLEATGESDSYYIYLDGIVKCECKRNQYENSNIGDKFIAVYFKRKIPEMCIKIT